MVVAGLATPHSDGAVLGVPGGQLRQGDIAIDVAVIGEVLGQHRHLMRRRPEVSRQFGDQSPVPGPDLVLGDHIPQLLQLIEHLGAPRHRSIHLITIHARTIGSFRAPTGREPGLDSQTRSSLTRAPRWAPLPAGVPFS